MPLLEVSAGIELEHDGRREFSRLGHKLLAKFSCYSPGNAGAPDLEAARRPAIPSSCVTTLAGDPAPNAFLITSFLEGFTSVPRRLMARERERTLKSAK